jgi:2-dehydropantoate 2-reductase
VQRIVDVFCKSNLPAVIAEDIRAEVWRKLMGNAAGNTVSALTRRGHYEMASDADLKPVSVGIMRETLNVAAAMGWDLRGEIDPVKTASRATPGPASTPSMLQDVLLGRPLEVEAHIGQTQAFGREKGVPTPTIDIVLPLLRALDKSLRELAK